MQHPHLRGGEGWLVGVFGLGQLLLGHVFLCPFDFNPILHPR